MKSKSRFESKGRVQESPDLCCLKQHQESFHKTRSRNFWILPTLMNQQFGSTNDFTQPFSKKTFGANVLFVFRLSLSGFVLKK